jgi:hypothetical protein
MITNMAPLAARALHVAAVDLHGLAASGDQAELPRDVELGVVDVGAIELTAVRPPA